MGFKIKFLRGKLKNLLQKIQLEERSVKMHTKFHFKETQEERTSTALPHF